MVPHANWHHPTSEHTKYSTYQQQCNGNKCSLWGMKMTTQPKLAEFSFYPLYSLLVSLNAEVLVVVVVVDCVQGSWSQVTTFSCYSHCLPLTQNASKGSLCIKVSELAGPKLILKKILNMKKKKNLLAWKENLLARLNFCWPRAEGRHSVRRL